MVSRCVKLLKSALPFLSLMLGAMQTLPAQGIRGRVVAAGTEVPLSGAIVQARAGDGQVVASTLTSERGNFTITELPDATYTLRVLRIGFRPFDSAPVVVTNGVSEVVVLAWIGDAIVLTPQVISSGRTCKVSADSGTMISNVWTEVRKALLSAVLAERGEAPLILRTNYARTLELRTGLVQRQRLLSESRRSFRAYTSWDADSLARFGYMSEGMVAGRPAMIYRAPDAVTLTTESFAGTHCFSLVNGQGKHANDIGLAFEPNGRPSNRVDIRGTFWIERATSRLQLIEFSYVGLPSYANPVKAGGYVEFVGLTTGQWLLSRWHIRMPHVAVQQPNGFGQGQERLEAVDESGGVVMTVTQGDTVIYSQSLPSLTVNLAGTSFMGELAGAKISLDGTELRATTNAAGRVVFRNVLAGRYNLRTSLVPLAMFGEQSSERVIVMEGVDRVDSVEVPDPRLLLRNACGNRAERNGVVALFGSVRDSAGNVADAGDGVVYSRAETVDTALAVPTIGSLVDLRGQFVMCSTQRGDVRVRAEKAVGRSDRLVHVPRDAAVLEVPMRLRPLVAASIDSVRAERAVIEFRVIDSEALPVPRIRIQVIDASGTSRSVSTDTFGRAFMLDVPRGPARVSSGKEVEDVVAMLIAGRNVVNIVLPDPPAAR